MFLRSENTVGVLRRGGVNTLIIIMLCLSWAAILCLWAYKQSENPAETVDVSRPPDISRTPASEQPKQSVRMVVSRWHTSTEIVPFQLKYELPHTEIYWPNSNARAVSAHVSHTGYTPAPGRNIPGGYGLWLDLYLFHDQGDGNFFNGSKMILLGRPEDGTKLVTKGKTYRIDCGDLIVEYEVDPFDWIPPPQPGWSGHFEGQVKITAKMKVYEER